MLEIAGIIFGGASRLFQGWMEMKDKDKEREHERLMFDKQIALQAQKSEADKELKQMDVESAQNTKELDALMTALQEQSAEATAAGGWVLKLSASVRPVISYWLLIIYTAAKTAAFYLALTKGSTIADALLLIYTSFDGALLGSIVTFWFADRSMLKRIGK
jgi:hypothetical protein